MFEILNKGDIPIMRYLLLVAVMIFTSSFALGASDMKFVSNLLRGSEPRMDLVELLLTRMNSGLVGSSKQNADAIDALIKKKIDLEKAKSETNVEEIERLCAQIEKTWTKWLEDAPDGPDKTFVRSQLSSVQGEKVDALLNAIRDETDVAKQSEIRASVMTVMDEIIAAREKLAKELEDARYKWEDENFDDEGGCPADKQTEYWGTIMTPLFEAQISYADSYLIKGKALERKSDKAKEAFVKAAEVVNLYGCDWDYHPDYIKFISVALRAHIGTQNEDGILEELGNVKTLLANEGLAPYMDRMNSSLARMYLDIVKFCIYIRRYEEAAKYADLGLSNLASVFKNEKNANIYRMGIYLKVYKMTALTEKFERQRPASQPLGKRADDVRKQLAGTSFSGNAKALIDRLVASGYISEEHWLYPLRKKAKALWFEKKYDESEALFRRVITGTRQMSVENKIRIEIEPVCWFFIGKALERKKLDILAAAAYATGAELFPLEKMPKDMPTGPRSPADNVKKCANNFRTYVGRMKRENKSDFHSDLYLDTMRLLIKRDVEKARDAGLYIGLELFSMKKYDEAIKEFQSLSKESKFFARAQFLKGKCHYYSALPLLNKKRRGDKGFTAADNKKLLAEGKNAIKAFRYYTGVLAKDKTTPKNEYEREARDGKLKDSLAAQVFIVKVYLNVLANYKGASGVSKNLEKGYKALTHKKGVNPKAKKSLRKWFGINPDDKADIKVIVDAFKKRSTPKSSSELENVRWYAFESLRNSADASVSKEGSRNAKNFAGALKRLGGAKKKIPSLTKGMKDAVRSSARSLKAWQYVSTTYRNLKIYAKELNDDKLNALLDKENARATKEMLKYIEDADPILLWNTAQTFFDLAQYRDSLDLCVRFKKKEKAENLWWNPVPGDIKNLAKNIKLSSLSDEEAARAALEEIAILVDVGKNRDFNKAMRLCKKIVNLVKVDDEKAKDTRVEVVKLNEGLFYNLVSISISNMSSQCNMALGRLEEDAEKAKDYWSKALVAYLEVEKEFGSSLKIGKNVAECHFSLEQWEELARRGTKLTRHSKKQRDVWWIGVRWTALASSKLGKEKKVYQFLHIPMSQFVVPEAIEKYSIREDLVALEAAAADAAGQEPAILVLPEDEEVDDEENVLEESADKVQE